VQRLGREDLGMERGSPRASPEARPEEVLMAWAREWAKEGVRVQWEKFMPPWGFQVLPRRWVVERTIAWIEHNRRMSIGTTSVYRRAQKRSSTWR
jgi:transposase